jgi:hypothetical protein
LLEYEQIRKNEEISQKPLKDMIKERNEEYYEEKGEDRLDEKNDDKINEKIPEQSEYNPESKVKLIF